MTTAEVVILAIVEGLTEFIPVSSTGHMILTEAVMHMQNDTTLNFLKTFTVNIQFGAILAVVVLYWRRFVQSFDFYFKLFVAFIPAAVIGLALHKTIERLLSSVTTVAISLIAGGLVLVLVDRVFKNQMHAVEDDKVMLKEINEFGMEEKREVLKKFNISWLQAFVIGCWQCLGMIPGVSRSAATIIGGLTQKFDIRKAAEFSFFLAVPTIFAASVFELMKNFSFVTGDNINMLIIGNLVSFVVGTIAIKFFIELITRFGLKFFGYYRIILGVAILVLLAMGHKLEMAG